MTLSPEEGRVVGSLVEKELTTPQQYPLSLNALVLACNQSSNRDPVVDFDERTVETALASLKGAGLVRFVYPSHGRSVTRYQHVLAEALGIDREQLALVAVLLLRGAQTAGELRSRTERMCDLESTAKVEARLLELSRLPEPAVVRLPRRPGQKEERWVQLLTDGPAKAAAAAPHDLEDAREPEAAAPGVEDEGVAGEGVAALGLLAPDGAARALAAQVAELRLEVAELRERLERLEEAL